MCHTGKADELLEVVGYKLRAIVRDDPWGGMGVHFSGLLEDDLDLCLGHGLLNLPVDDCPAVAIQNAAQVVERSHDIEVGHIDMPVLVGRPRLLEARALATGAAIEILDASGILEHAVDA